MYHFQVIIFIQHSYVSKTTYYRTLLRIALLIVITSASLDLNYVSIFLKNQSQTLHFFSEEKLVAATRVGGVRAMTRTRLDSSHFFSKTRTRLPKSSVTTIANDGKQSFTLTYTFVYMRITTVYGLWNTRLVGTVLLP
jgi:hypothetical protein